MEKINIFKYPNIASKNVGGHFKSNFLSKDLN